MELERGMGKRKITEHNKKYQTNHKNTISNNNYFLLLSYIIYISVSRGNTFVMI